MKIYHYIQKDNSSGGLMVTSSPTTLPTNSSCVKLDEASIEKYNKHIKYIDCCDLDSNGELTYDYIKILSYKLRELSLQAERTIKELRSLIIEAAALNKSELVHEIAQIIKDINEFLNQDFSNITDINQIETLTCPELNIDYVRYYASQIYEI